MNNQSGFSKNNKKSREGNVKSIITWVIVIAVIAGSVGSMLFVGGGNPTGNQTAILTDSISQTDWFLGKNDAKVVLVEYGDYQCPACAAYHPFTKEIVREFGDSIAFVYRYFPLRSIHKNADITAQAAEAAGKQAKFWEMHDLLYKNQKSWENASNAEEIVIGYAESLGLNLEQFKVDLKSQIVKDKIEGDYQSGLKAQIQGTPTFFVNGKSIQNPLSYDEFRTILIKNGATPQAVSQ
ncbi:MAG: DSBA oxidoreductase [Parcubacteria group bacterium Gr01-1014_20]|nr:MAG: DSBA oxidoreductase [Parcubacteria group bacterium Gr01-1014_20]